MAKQEALSPQEAAIALGPSDPELQIKFLEGLMASKTEAEKFLADPEVYSYEHKLVLDPKVISYVLDAMIIDPEHGRHTEEELPPAVRARLQNLASPATIAAWPAAVAAVSAAVAAGAAVASAVCACSGTVLRPDFESFGKDDVIMPSK